MLVTSDGHSETARLRHREVAQPANRRRHHSRSHRDGDAFDDAGIRVTGTSAGRTDYADHRRLLARSLLYELLTGHRPYRLVNRAPHEIARVICEEAPAPPSIIITRTDDLLPSLYTGDDATTLKQLYTRAVRHSSRCAARSPAISTTS